MMSDADWISIIAVAEFAGLVTLILLVLVTRGWRGRRRDKAAVHELVEHVRKHHGERRAELEKALAEVCGLEGEELKQHVQRMLQLERHFYDDFISTYLGRDRSGVSQMDERLKDVIRPYLEMNRAGGPAPAAPEGAEEPAPAAAPADGVQTAELAEDLVLYRRTLNRLFGEYTAMFGVHLDPGQELSATEILGRLESGQLTGDEAGEADATEEPAEGEDVDFRAEETDDPDALIEQQQKSGG